VIVEPDVRNAVAVGRRERPGFAFAGLIDLDDKRAELAFLTRPGLEAQVARLSSDHGVPR
jgi:hypothetical protein